MDSSARRRASAGVSSGPGVDIGLALLLFEVCLGKDSGEYGPVGVKARGQLPPRGDPREFRDETIQHGTQIDQQCIALSKCRGEFLAWPIEARPSHAIELGESLADGLCEALRLRAVV